MDQQRVLNEFYEAGYQDVTFDWRAEPGEDPDEVIVFYTVNPGDRVLIGRTILSGSHRTRDDVVNRQIELDPGSSLSQVRISASRRNLYDLGVFSKVDVAVQNPEGSEHAKNVLFQVEEARRWAIGGGGGAEFARIGRNTAELTNPAGDATFSPRMTLEITRLNVRGKAHTMSLRTRLSLLQQRGLFTYEAPRWFASDRWRLTLSGLYDTFRNVNTFTGRRFEGAFQLTQQLNPSTTVLYRYAYRRTSIDENTLNIEPLLVPLISQPVRIGLLSSTYISDRRDDPTDTSTGMYNTMNVALASKYWGGQPNFARVLAQNSTYHRIGTRIVFARTVQLGINKPWAGHGPDRRRESGRGHSSGSENPALGAILRGRRELAPRLRVQPGRAARSGNGLSARRRRPVPQQPRVAVPARRGGFLRRPLSRCRQRLFPAGPDQLQPQPARPDQPRRHAGIRIRLHGACHRPGYSLPYAGRGRSASTWHTARTRRGLSASTGLASSS